MYFSGDSAGATKAAWDKLHDMSKGTLERKINAEKEKAKEKLVKLPRPHGSGGGTATSATITEPQNMKEAHKMAKAYHGGVT